MPCDCHNSDAEHEVALADVSRRQDLCGWNRDEIEGLSEEQWQKIETIRKEAADFIREVFSLPGVQQAVYDVEANEMADTMEAMIEEGISL